jgi:hypothetical protein
MDIPYEKNAATLLTAIITAVITIMLFNTIVGMKESFFFDEYLLKKRDDIRSYITLFTYLQAYPKLYVLFAASFMPFNQEGTCGYDMQVYPPIVPNMLLYWLQPPERIR